MKRTRARCHGLGRGLVAAAVACASLAFAYSPAEAAQRGPSTYRFRNHGGYGVGWRHASPYHHGPYNHGHYHWHDTSHYDWHDTSHYHRVGPFLILHRTGHWDFHPDGHWDHHGGGYDHH